jgi:hypothetical protein
MLYTKNLNMTQWVITCSKVDSNYKKTCEGVGCAKK